MRRPRRTAIRPGVLIGCLCLTVAAACGTTGGQARTTTPGTGPHGPGAGGCRTPGVTRHASVIVLDGTGRSRWHADLPVADPGSQAGPLASTTTVFTNEGDELAAFDLATGHRRWRLAVPGPVYGEWDTPGGLVAVIDEVGPHAEVIGVDPHSGRMRWRDPFPKGLYADQYPTADGGLVLLSSPGNLSVIDDTDGGTRWRAPGPVQGVVPLALGDGLVIRNTGTTFTAYDQRSGSVRWQAPADPRSAPLVVGQTVVETAAASPDPEHLTGYDLATGRQIWQLDQSVDTGTGGRFATGVGLVTTPASGAGGTLTLSDPHTGHADWSLPAGPAVIDVDPEAVGSDLVTIEGGTVAEPALHAVWRRIADGSIEASVLLPVSSANGAVVDAHGDVIVLGGSPSGQSLVAVGRRVLWQAPLPEVAQRDPVPLADGDAVVQVESPPTACGLSGSRSTMPFYRRLREIDRSGFTIDATYRGQTMAPWQRKVTTSSSLTSKRRSRLVDRPATRRRT